MHTAEITVKADFPWNICVLIKIFHATLCHCPCAIHAMSDPANVSTQKYTPICLTHFNIYSEFHDIKIQMNPRCCMSE